MSFLKRVWNISDRIDIWLTDKFGLNAKQKLLEMKVDACCAGTEKALNEALGLNAYYSKDYKITKNMVLNFAEATGDLNPIHFDEDFAKQTRFKGCIVHGMLTAGLISASLTDHYGNGTIYVSQNLTFERPVKVGNIVRITFKGEIKNKKTGFTSLYVEAFVKNKLVLHGTAVILLDNVQDKG